MNYYNEFNPAAAAWLRELIARKLIPDGVVDERSITEINAPDLEDFTQCHFFAGIGGWSLALQLAGWPEDRPVWTGSCPCQPFANIGLQLAQLDERHLWPAFFKLIRECRPVAVFGEQVADAIGKGWLDGVSADLEGENYACGATVLGAHSVGAPHIRQRLYWVGHPFGAGLEGYPGDGDPIDRQGWQETKLSRSDAPPAFPWDQHRRLSCSDGGTRRLGSYPREVVDGLPPPIGTHSRLRQRYRPASRGRVHPSLHRNFDPMNPPTGWKKVSFAAECLGGDDDEPGDECSICGLDYSEECECPGPTQEDEYEYQEFNGTLYAKLAQERIANA